jgi:hypothetical protein
MATSKKGSVCPYLEGGEALGHGDVNKPGEENEKTTRNNSEPTQYH